MHAKGKRYIIGNYTLLTLNLGRGIAAAKLISIALLIIIAIGVPIAVLVSAKNSYSTDNIAVVGNTILLSFKYTIAFVSSVTFTVSSILQDVAIKIYPLRCNELEKHIATNELVLNSNETTGLKPIADVDYFDTCSPYPGICVLEKDYYFINTPSAFLHFTITLSSYTEGYTEVNLHTFDNPDDLQNFLEDKPFKSIKDFPMKNQTAVFVASADIERPTYLYVAIKNVRDKVDSFIAEREALTDFYKPEDLVPVVTLSNTNNSVELSVQDFNIPKSDKVCFLAAVDGNVSCTENQVFRIHVKGDVYYILSNLGIWGTVGIAVASVVTAAIAAIIILLLCACCRHKLCKQR